MNSELERRLMLEKMLLRYSVALEAGDFDTVAAILQAAEMDGELETMILALNDEYATELGPELYPEISASTLAEDRALAAALIQAALLSNPPPALTVGEVFARIRADAARRLLPLDRADLAATQAHTQTNTPLPEDLSLRRVSQLLSGLGVQVSSRLQEFFRSTAILMRMGDSEAPARMAATRRYSPLNDATLPAPQSMMSIAESRGVYLAARDAAPEDAALPPAPAQAPIAAPDKTVGEQGLEGQGAEEQGAEEQSVDEQ